MTGEGCGGAAGIVEGRSRTLAQAEVLASEPLAADDVAVKPALLAVFIGAPFLVISVPSASSVQRPQYRFTGWVTASPTLAAGPTHLVVEGDAPQLRFTDRWNLTSRRTSYRGCVSKLLASPSRCLVATAPIDGKPSVLPLPVRCCGEFVARWYVGRRLVAGWRFRYVPEHA